MVIKEFLSPSFSGEGYKAYKLFTYFVPFILLTSLYYLKDFEFAIPQKKNFGKKTAVIIFLCLLILGNIWSVLAMVSVSASQSGSINKDIIGLQKIADFDNVSSINIEEKSFWDQMWMYYFLFERKTVYLKYPTYYGASPQNGEWTLRKNSISVGDILVGSSDENKTILLLNKGYFLEKSSSPLETNLLEGWYDLESNSFAKWRWTGSSNHSIIGLHAKEDLIATVSLRYWPVDMANSFSISLDDKKITDCKEINYCLIENLTVSKGAHTLIIKPALPPSSGRDADRALSYAFTEIKIDIKH
jgi:hypothetical protein